MSETSQLCFYNRDSFEVHILLNILLNISMLMDFHETSITGILLMRWSQWGVQPYANFKTAHFAKYLSSMLMDFHETSITGILFMRQSKWVKQPYANFKSAHFVKYLSSMLVDFHELLQQRFFWWDDQNEA